MKKISMLSLLILLTLISSVFTPCGNASLELWSQTYGGDSYETATVVVETSGDNGLAIAGGTTSFGFGDGEYDFWLIKTNSYGVMEWNQTYGKEGDDYPYSLIETVDGGFALVGKTGGGGSFLGDDYDVLLIKTDKFGNVQWNKTFGGTKGDSGNCLIQTSDGGFAFVGYTELDTTGCDFWLVKIDSDGNIQWQKTYALGVNNYNRAGSLVELSDGGYVIVGTVSPFMGGGDSWFIKVDQYGNMVWNQTYKNGKLFSIVKTVDGFVLAGDTRSYGAKGLDDFWLLKTDAVGNVEWNQTFGGASSDVSSDLIQTLDGGFAIAGYTESFGEGARDFWLIKTDATGKAVWNQTYGDSRYCDANSLVQTFDGGFVLVGAVNSISPSSDWWVIKADMQGIPEFSSWTPLLIMLVAFLIVAVIYRQKLSQRRAEQ